MKKFEVIIATILLLVLLLVLPTLGSSNTGNRQVPVSTSTFGELREKLANKSRVGQATPEKEIIDDGKNLVIYFSVTGTTETVARQIAKAADADIVEIVPAVAYTQEDIDYNNDQSRTTIEQNDVDARPALSGETIKLDGYSTIYLGYPIWWGQAPRIMSTFVESVDFGDRTVIPFCTSGGSGIGDTATSLEELANGGKWLEGIRFGTFTTDAEIADWIAGLKKN